MNRNLIRPARTVFSLGLVVFGLTFSSLSAFAQASKDQQDVGVMDRQRPAYDAKGVPAGGFRIFPTLDLESGYDDNVFSLHSKQSDFYFSEIGAARIKSEWGRHFLEAFAGVSNYNYASLTQLNLTDWNVGTDGRLDIQRDSALSGGGTFGEYHEPLFSPNTVGNQAAPTRYYKGHADVTATYGINRLSFTAAGSFDHYTYENVALNGGGLLNNRDRDEDTYQGYVRALYDFSSGYSIFAKTSYDGRAYNQFFDRAGYHRNSVGYRYDAGVDLQLTHLVQGEIYIGYLQQHFDQAVPRPLKNISGLDFGGQLDWYADPVITVHLSGGHQVSDVTIAGVSASDDESVRLSADYEVTYNVIAQGYLAYTHSQLKGLGRVDEYPGAGVSVKYLLNNYLSADLSYRFHERTSNVAGSGFSDNIISIGITGHV